jgi:SPP1 gp7 family putative phage head morphogenesis protein
LAYWQDRLTETQDKLADKSIKQMEKQLKKYYKQSMKKVIEEFEKTYNKILLQIEDGQEPTPALLYKLDTYWSMQAQLKAEAEKLGDKQIKLLSEGFETLFFDVYYSIALEGEMRFSSVSVETAREMINQIWLLDGKHFKERIWGNTNKLVETLNEELIHCVLTGKKSDELKRLLIKRFDVSYSQADMLVRTETAHIQSTAAHKRYLDAGVSEYEVWASKDERRCEICGAKHLKRYPIYHPTPVPFHPNCRCTIIPVIDD